MSRELFNYTELMPYNELAGAKYPMVGMHFSLKEMKKLNNVDYTVFFRMPGY